METVTIPEVFGTKSVQIQQLNLIDTLDGLNAIFDRVKGLSLALNQAEDPNVRDSMHLAINQAIADGEKLVTCIEKSKKKYRSRN